MTFSLSKITEVFLWAGYRIMRKVRCYTASIRDAARYLRHSSTLEHNLTLTQLEALIISQYHALEKGFSLTNTKKVFGINHVKYLLKLMRSYRESGYDCNRDIYQSSLSTLKSYLTHHTGQESYLGETGPEIKDICAELVKEIQSPSLKCHVHDFPDKNDAVTYQKLVLTRASVRMFTGEPVPNEKILRALELARVSPSSCNRQPWRVLRIRNPQRIKLLCSLQRGNKGFGHLAGEILIISADCSVYYGAHERNQAFIDGGIFSMAVLMAVHSVGIGACALNWSVTNETDKQLRKEFNLPDQEVVIMCIALGVLPEEFMVARSDKKSLAEIVRMDQL